MIVVGAEVGLDGDDAVAARLVFDDDRLPPFGLQLFGEQPCADIGASAGAERHHEPHGSGWPVLGLGRRRQHHKEQSQNGANTPEIPIHDVSPVVRLLPNSNTYTSGPHDGARFGMSAAPNLPNNTRLSCLSLESSRFGCGLKASESAKGFVRSTASY
jgi:hypothetical protein